MRRWLRTGSRLAVALTALVGLTTPAWGAWMQPPAPYLPKDFAVVKKDGVYHLFYIRHNVNLPGNATENDFGHAFSSDLIHWTQDAPVLATAPDGWDNEHVWAPSIIEKNGLYYMFYAGVNQTPGVYDSYQRIGFATSPDLETWTHQDAPVFSCAQVPWAFCNPLNNLTGFRDPFVMPDPSTPGSWLMFYTANVASDSLTEIVGLAESDSTLTAWNDLGPMWVTYRTVSGSGTAESPHVFQHAGLWYLFDTVNGVDPIAFSSSPNPKGDLSSWTYRGRLTQMLGYYTGSWFASEHLQDGLLEYFFYVNNDRIEYYRMNWTGVAVFTLVQPDPFHVTAMQWNADTVYAGTGTAMLELDTVNGFNRSASIEAVVTDSHGLVTVLPADSVGLPGQIPVSDPATLWEWLARTWPSGSDQPMRLVVRTTDQTAATPKAIVVMPDTSGSSVPAFQISRLFWQADTVQRGGAARLGIAAGGWSEHVFPFEVFTLDTLGQMIPAPLDSLGFPPTLQLDADTTYFSWPSRTWPDSAGGPRATRIVVRDADDTTIVTQPALLVMLPDPVGGGGSGGSGGNGNLDGDGPGELLFMLPGRGSTQAVEFGLRLPARAEARLDLFDVQGRRVARLADRAFPRGTSVIAWDGRRADGARARPGIYFARLWTGRVTRTVRTVLLP